MEVKNISNTMMLSQYKPKHGLEVPMREKCAGISTNHSADKNISKSINKNEYNGSFTGKEKAAVKFSEKILDNLIDGCNNHTTIVQNLVALFLALGPRPLAIMSLPGKKNKEDKIYASGHAMASGLIGFAFASIVMYPLGLAAKKIRKDAQNILGKIDKSNDVKLVIKRLKNLSQQDNPDLEKLKPEKLLEGTSFYDTNPDKYIKKYGVPYDKEFIGEFSSLTEDGKLSEHIDLNHIDYDNFHSDYNKKHLSRAKLMEGTKYIKDKYADKFIKNFVELDKNGQFVRLNKKLDFDMIYKAVNMAPDVFVFGVAKAMLTVALIPPILKYVFGLEKGKKKAPESVSPAGQSAQSESINTFNKVDKSFLSQEVKEGGVK